MKGNFKDLTNRKFGRLTVLKRTKYNNSFGYWLCKCDCGKETIVYTERLTRGETKSCGCLNKELMVKRNYIHGIRNTRVYSIWNETKMSQSK